MDNSSDRLWAVFLEARSGNQRTQWLVFPPRLTEILGGAHGREGYGRFIKRRIEYKGHKAKWQTTTKPASSLLLSTVKDQLAQYESTGWVILDPILIRLEEDDYAKAWAGADATTPYKALRHVEKVALKRGYRLTSD